tara:strand:- start:119 stop:406 length:288 start_codon:yes stop_codon:yes gene_type:complete
VKGKVVGVIEKSSYIFYFSITLETIHGMMISGDIMFPYKTDLLGAFDDSACPSSSGGSFLNEIILNLLGLTIIYLFLTIFFLHDYKPLVFFEVSN